MEFFETIEKRKSIRRFTTENVDNAVIEKALAAAILAPNSSNMQTWNFYWVQNAAKKEKLIQACFNQSAARTASHLIVVEADPKLWKRSLPRLRKFVQEIEAPKAVQMYYQKLVPHFYRWGLFNSYALIKKPLFACVGLFRPFSRKPITRRDMQEVSIKSAALAAQNFVLAIAAQNYASCMMEGFDEVRVNKVIGQKSCGGSSRIVMVIAVGAEGEKGTWGPRWRLPLEEVVKII